jgi:hypothetical protein
MKKHQLIALLAYGIMLIAILAACQPKVVGADVNEPAGVTNPDTSSDNPAETAVPEGEDAAVDETESIVEYLTNLPMAEPVYTDEQVLNPMARMNSPESLEGSGVFPDNYFTSDILKTGSRGCLSCHADIYGLVVNMNPIIHPVSYPTYGKTDDIEDCIECHKLAGALGGPSLINSMHSMHMNSTLFEDTYQGSCWSCHALDADGEMVLWDMVKFDAYLAGYNDSTSDGVIQWTVDTGYEKGNMIGFDMVSDLGLGIEN